MDITIDSQLSFNDGNGDYILLDCKQRQQVRELISKIVYGHYSQRRGQNGVTWQSIASEIGMQVNKILNDVHSNTTNEFQLKQTEMSIRQDRAERDNNQILNANGSQQIREIQNILPSRLNSNPGGQGHNTSSLSNNLPYQNKSDSFLLSPSSIPLSEASPIKKQGHKGQVLGSRLLQYSTQSKQDRPASIFQPYRNLPQPYLPQPSKPSPHIDYPTNQSLPMSSSYKIYCHNEYQFNYHLKPSQFKFTYTQAHSPGNISPQTSSPSLHPSNPRQQTSNQPANRINDPEMH